MLQELRDLGLEVTELTATDGTHFAAITGYVIELGRFADREIDLAVQATQDFPKTVASAIHVRARPQLYAIGDNIPEVRNITKSVLGPDWCYWSHNFNWQGERNARRLVSQINRIFHDAR